MISQAHLCFERAALLSMMLVCMVVSVRAFNRPNLTWAFIADTTDAIFAETALDHWYGLKAAEYYINTNDLLQGTQVNITSVQGLSPASTAADFATLSTTVTTLNPFGFVLPDWVNSQTVMDVFAGGNKPVVQPETTSGAAYTTAYRNVLFTRQAFTAEHLALINYAVNGQSLCSYSAVVATIFAGITDMVNNISSAMQALNQPATLNIMVDANNLNASQVKAIVKQQFFAGSRAPGCVFMIGLNTQMVTFVEALWEDSRFDQTNTYFFATSASNALLFNTSYGTAPLANLRISFSTSKPSDATIPSVKTFEDAYNAFVATHPVPPAFLTANITASHLQGIGLPGEYSYNAYDGFMAMMFVANTLQSMTDFTSSSFVDTVYQRKFFNMNETIWGPFSDRCLVNSPTPFPCFCNTGGRTYWIAQVNLTSGKLMGGVESQILQDGSLMTITTALDVCNVAVTDILTPLNLAMVFKQEAASAEVQNAQMQFAISLVSAAIYANTGGYIAAFGRLNPLFQLVSGSLTDYTELLTNIKTRSNPYALVGGDVPSGTSGIPSFFRNALTVDLTDPVFTTATQYTHYELAFTPVLADYIHALATYATRADGLNILTPGVYIAAYDTAAVWPLIQKSFWTYQVDIPGATDMTSFSTSVLNSVISRVVTRAASGAKTVFFFGSTNHTFTTQLLVALARAATSSLTTAAQQASLQVMIASGKLAFFYAKNALNTAGVSLPSGVSVVFGSNIQEWWVPTSSVYQGVVAFRQTTDPAIVEHPASALGFLASTLIYTATKNVLNTATPAGLVSSIYSSGTISSFGTSYGPFYSNNCSAAILASQTVDRTCQCYKGPRNFYVLSFNDWILNKTGSTNYFMFAMTTCGVRYLPLEVAAQLNVALVAGVIGGVGPVLLGGIACLIYLAVKPKRDNKYAPKEADKPFAMMFTDIQSSTSLWGRAPQQMGECVERHHNEIRKLISRFDGYEVKTIGDSFMIAFKKADDAVRLALELQSVFYNITWPPEIDDTYRALAREASEEAAQDGKADTRTVQGHWEDDPIYHQNWNGLRVRVGLHWGVGSIKLDPVSQGYDFYGTLVNTAARVEGVGNGGQVLVTKDMYDELERCEFDFSVVDVTPLGPQPLRGLDAPVPLIQLNPMVLKTRTFNALRLDVENAAEEDSETSEATAETGSRGSSTALADATATGEQIVERIVKSRKTPPNFSSSVLYLTSFIDVAFSTSTRAWRHDTIKHLLGKWGVRARKRLSAETDEHYEMVTELTLMAKIAMAHQEVIPNNPKLRRYSHLLSMPATPTTFLNTPDIPNRVKNATFSSDLVNQQSSGQYKPLNPSNVGSPGLPGANASTAS